MTLATTILQDLRRLSDPARAPQMQAYMKSAMPYLGVKAQLVQQVCRAGFRDRRWADAADWQADVLAMWRGAQFREQRYCAIELSGVRAAREFQTLAALPMYEEMIVSGAWWDYVDTIAQHRLGGLLRREPDETGQIMRAWATDADLWKRRSAILCQNAFKRDTDLALLYACIEPSLESSEFFLRKAIGWALRQYARIDPAEVQRYVGANAGRMSGLSQREALKHVGGAA